MADDFAQQILDEHGYDPTTTPAAPARNDALSQHGKILDALRSFFTPASVAVNPNTPQTQAAYGRALAGPPGKLPPVPGSPVFDPGTGAALDAGGLLLPELKGLLGVKAAAAAPAVVKGLSRLGGDAREAAAFNHWIAPHMNEDDFVDKFFGGYHAPQKVYGGPGVIFQTHPGLGGKPEFGFSGSLHDPSTANGLYPGEKVAEIDRGMFPADQKASHDLLVIDPKYRGLGKTLLQGQMDVYDKLGINHVSTYANLGDGTGGYTWAKYGFLPNGKMTWEGLQEALKSRLSEMLPSRGTGRSKMDAFVGHPDVQQWGTIDEPTRQRVLNELGRSKKDPTGLWRIADWSEPTRGGLDSRGNPLSVGKALLFGQKWGGKLDPTNVLQRERFNDYIGR